MTPDKNAKKISHNVGRAVNLIIDTRNIKLPDERNQIKGKKGGKISPTVRKVDLKIELLLLLLLLPILLWCGLESVFSQCKI